MKETPIFSATGNFTTNVNRNYTLKESIPVSHFGNLVMLTSDLSDITDKNDMATWIANHLKVTITPEIPNSTAVEVGGASQTLTYISGTVSPSLVNAVCEIDASDNLTVTISVNFMYTVMVYHSSVQGVDIAVPEVTIPFSVFGVITD